MARIKFGETKDRDISGDDEELVGYTDVNQSKRSQTKKRAKMLSKEKGTMTDKDYDRYRRKSSSAESDVRAETKPKYPEDKSNIKIKIGGK